MVLSVKLLKAAGDIILDSLGSIFNLSLQTGIFPDDWKLAKVSLIFKARLQSILRMCGLCLHFCFGLDPLQLYNMKYSGYALNKWSPSQEWSC